MSIGDVEVGFTQFCNYKNGGMGEAGGTSIISVS